MSKNSFKKNTEFAKIANFAALQSEEYLTFDDEVYQKMPECLKPFFKFSSKRENDMFLNALLPVLGLALFRLKGSYADSVNYPTLYSINCAPPASGKGVQNYIYDVVRVLEKFLKEKFAFTLKLSELHLPGNSSAAAVMEFFKRNDIALIVETEMDVISLTINQDWGDYTTVLRQAFHHERVSINRKDGKYFSVEQPKVSIALAGTPDQLRKFFGSAENGLFSRFMIYMFNAIPEFKSVKPREKNFSYSDLVAKVATELLPLIEKINSIDVNFTLSDAQWDKMQTIYNDLVKKYSSSHGTSAVSSVTRLALIQFRIAMIFSAFRKVEEGKLNANIECDEVDFRIAGKLINVYLSNINNALNLLPSEAIKIQNTGEMRLYEALPDEFTTSEAKSIAATESICSDRSVDNYLGSLSKKGLLTSVKFGTYKKVATS